MRDAIGGLRRGQTLVALSSRLMQQDLKFKGRSLWFEAKSLCVGGKAFKFTTGAWGWGQKPYGISGKACPNKAAANPITPPQTEDHQQHEFALEHADPQSLE